MVNQTKKDLEKHTQEIESRKTTLLKLKTTKKNEDILRKYLQEYGKVFKKVLEVYYNQLLPNTKEFSEKEFQIDNYDALDLKDRKGQLKPKKKLNTVINIDKIKEYDNQKNYPWKPIYQDGKIYISKIDMIKSHFTLRKLFLPSKNYDSLFDMNEYSTLKNRTALDYVLKNISPQIKSHETKKKEIKERIEKIELELKEIPKEQKRKLEKKQNIIKKLKEKINNISDYNSNCAEIGEGMYDIGVDEKGLYIQFREHIHESLPKVYFQGERQKKIFKQSLKDIDQKTGKPLKNQIKLLNDKKGNLVVAYVTRTKIKLDKPDDSYTAIGIDLGIYKPIVAAVTTKHNKEPTNIKFIKPKIMNKSITGYHIISKRFHWLRKRATYNKIQVKRGKKFFELIGKKFENQGNKKWFHNKKLTSKEKNYLDNMTHLYTTEFINYVESLNLEKPIIVMEDLKYIRDNKPGLSKYNKVPKKIKKNLYKIHTWRFDEIQKQIKYKALNKGIPVMNVILPKIDGVKLGAYSSMTCSKCGCKHKDNRLEKHKFICTKCNYTADDDFNAAVNISRQYYQMFEKYDSLFHTKLNEYVFKKKVNEK